MSWFDEVTKEDYMSRGQIEDMFMAAGSHLLKGRELKKGAQKAREKHKDFDAVLSRWSQSTPADRQDAYADMVFQREGTYEAVAESVYKDWKEIEENYEKQEQAKERKQRGEQEFDMSKYTDDKGNIDMKKSPPPGSPEYEQWRNQPEVKKQLDD
jgi:hypothetical protein